MLEVWDWAGPLLKVTRVIIPEGPYTPTMELGPKKKPSLFWFSGPNSIMVVYVGPSGYEGKYTYTYL